MKEGITISEPPSTYSFLKVFSSCYWEKEVLKKVILVVNEFFAKFALNHEGANVTAHVISVLNSKSVEELGKIKRGPKQGSLFLPSQSSSLFVVFSQLYKDKTGNLY